MDRRVKPAELVGRWLLDETGEVGLRYAGYTKLTPAEHQIVLRSDRTCHLRTYLDPRSSGKNVPYVDQECRWDLKNFEEQEVDLRLATAPATSAMSLFVGEEDGHLVLWNYIDDPDQWKYVQFAKQPGVV